MWVSWGAFWFDGFALVMLGLDWFGYEWMDAGCMIYTALAESQMAGWLDT